MTFTIENLKSGVKQVQVNILPIGDELNILDGKLGDGDLGVTLVSGFNNMHSVLADLPEDLGLAFFSLAKAITKVSGSSFGTLMATALMAAGKQLKGEKSSPVNKIPDLLIAAQAAMIARGGASLGDKTILDSIDAIITATQGCHTLEKVLEAASEAAETALIEFNKKPNKIGRARIFGDRTIGMDDPGMVAIVRIINSFN